LDLLGFGHPTAERLADIFKELCRLEVEADGVFFDPRLMAYEDIRAQDEYAGIRVKLRAAVGKAVVPLQVDVGFRDALPVAPEEITFSVMLGMACAHVAGLFARNRGCRKAGGHCQIGHVELAFQRLFLICIISRRNFPSRVTSS
jgi:hypothetical protein